MKKSMAIILIIVILTAVTTGVVIYCEFYNKDIVVSCNNVNFSEGIINMYFVTEANKLNYADYESGEEYFKDLSEKVLTRVSIDSYYETMCIESGTELSEQEEIALEITLVSKMVELGFDYGKCEDSDAYQEYFGASRKEFREFYTKQELYKKYYIAEATRISSTTITRRDIRNAENIKERLELQELYDRVNREREVLEASIENYFNDNRMTYASNNVEVIYLEYPKDEQGNFMTDKNSEYKNIASQIRNDLSGGGYYYHQMKERYPGYVKSSEFYYVNETSSVVALYGEEFIEACLNGNEGQFYIIECDSGVIVIRILDVTGREEYSSDIEYIIKEKELGNSVRKALLEESYDPVINNNDPFASIEFHKSLVWENLLEK